MIIDIAAPDSYLMVNKKAIDCLGLEVAAYFTVLLNIGKTVVRKGKFDENGFFKVDRKFVESETSIISKRQKELDLILQKIDLLTIMGGNADKVRIQAEKYAEIITNEEIAETKRIRVDEKTQKATNKRDGILLMLKSALKATDEDVRAAEEDLVEVLYDKGLVKKVQVQLLEDKIDSYRLTKQSKIKLIQQMTLNGWKDPEWILEKDRKGFNFEISAISENIATPETVNKQITI